MENITLVAVVSYGIAALFAFIGILAATTPRKKDIPNEHKF
jgi:hypothetical protein